MAPRDGKLIFDPSSFGLVPKDSIPPQMGCDTWVFWKNTIPQIWEKERVASRWGFCRFSPDFPGFSPVGFFPPPWENSLMQIDGLLRSHQIRGILCSFLRCLEIFQRFRISGREKGEIPKWQVVTSQLKNWCFIRKPTTLGGKNWRFFFSFDLAEF